MVLAALGGNWRRAICALHTHAAQPMRVPVQQQKQCFAGAVRPLVQPRAPAVVAAAAVAAVMPLPLRLRGAAAVLRGAVAAPVVTSAARGAVRRASSATCARLGTGTVGLPPPPRGAFTETTLRVLRLACGNGFGAAAASAARAFARPCSQQRAQYVAYVRMCRAAVARGATAVSPYWRALAADVELAANGTSHWLPSLPAAVARVHVHVLSALFTVGPYLPRTIAFALAEAMRSSCEAKALGFETYSGGGGGVNADGDAGGGAAGALGRLLLPERARAVLAEWAASVRSAVRLAWLLLVFAPVLLLAPAALLWDVGRPAWMYLLRRTLETGGAFFIKWGQWAATRHDLFPPDMCASLAHLHTQAPAHAFRHTKTILERAFGMPLSDVFETFETAPVASGSIGQIHRATLSARGAAVTGCHAGQIVAVKVRHPGTADAILADFEAMLWVASALAGLPAAKGLRLEDTLRQFAAPLKEQVDLAREASNLSRFNFNFRKTNHVRFPVPLFPLVSADVLVESFEEGDHITRYIETAGCPYNHRLSELGSGTMLQMMLVDNLIHSDLHPGNILVRLNPPTGLLGACYGALDRLAATRAIDSPTRRRIRALQRRWLQPQIVLLDVGMATEMNGEDQVNMVGLFRSFAKLDGEACGSWVLRFSGDTQACPDPDGFKAGMRAAFDVLRAEQDDDAGAARSADGDTAIFRNTAEALASVLELIRQHQVSLPGHICAVVVTTLVLEGWSNKLDPDHSVLSQVQKMFEGSNVPWRERMGRVVDSVMCDEEQHTALM